MDGMSIAVMCLALNVYFESSGEPPEGMAAVAHVTINRAKAKDVELCTVVAEEFQFSWANGGGIIRTSEGWYLSPALRKRVNREGLAWKNAESIALAAFYTSDLTKGATHYHTTKVNPVWNRAPDMKYLRTIGAHKFYRFEPPTKEQ